ncbi:MAG: hypothetical protein R3D78_03050 [Paracoccaceae bacterium]
MAPDADTRKRAAATKIRAAFESVPFIVDVDDSFAQVWRLRATINSTIWISFRSRKAMSLTRLAC